MGRLMTRAQWSHRQLPPPVAPLVGGQAAAAPSLWGAPGAAAPASAPAASSLSEAWNPPPKGPSLAQGAQMAHNSQTAASGLPANLASVLLPSTTNPQILRGLNNHSKNSSDKQPRVVSSPCSSGRSVGRCGRHDNNSIRGYGREDINMRVKTILLSVQSNLLNVL